MRRRGCFHIAEGILLVSMAACATAAGKRDSLPRSIAAYSELLRWGKVDGAASFHLPENQAAFVARYTAAEDDLHIESIEVRAVAFPPVQEDEPLAADVTLVAQAYLLPSTVVEKTVIVQRWEHRDGGWRIVRSSRELAPPLAPTTPSAGGAGADDAGGGDTLDSGDVGPDTGPGATIRPESKGSDDLTASPPARTE